MRRNKLISEVFGDELAITPSDLCNHDTGKQLLFGYRRKPVDALLEQAADVLESLIEQARNLKGENEDLRNLLDEHRQMESTLRNALVSSQKFSEEIVESARREAAAIVSEAKARKSETELEAAKIPEQLAREIRLLEDQRDRLRRDILAALDAHQALVDNLLPERAREPGHGSFFEVDAVRKRVEAIVALESDSEDDANTPPAPSSNGEPESDAGTLSADTAGPVAAHGVETESTAPADGGASEETRA